MAGLLNLGSDLGLKHGPIRRLIFTLTKDDAGADNVIPLSNAAAIANWKMQFDKYSHLSDYSDRFVPTPLVREFTKEDVEAIEWEVEDYKRIMRPGDVDILFSLLDNAPYILKNLKVWEDYTISVWPVSEDNKVLGILSGTDLKPFPIKVNSLGVPYWSPGGYEEGSRNVVSFRVNAATDMNLVVAVTIADGDVTSSSDFYSLRNATATVATPAVTGCDFTPTVTDVDPDDPTAVIPIAGIVFGEVIFTDDDGVSGDTSLAAAGSISYLAGVYTVNEAGLLVSGHSYTMKISHSGYDITVATVTIP